MQKFVIEKATQKDLNSILNITKNALKSMKAMKFNQWNEQYPNEENFKKKIKTKELYLYKKKDEILGFIC
ncbi:GNAT family N-acetyltransferase, partial [Campylobacter coli]